MQFSKLSKYLQKLENTSKRLEMTSILTDLINELDVSEVEYGINLSLGYLQASYQSEKFNIADKMVIRALAEAFQVDSQEIIGRFGDVGDLGDVAQSFANTDTTNVININDVHNKLTKIAKLEGAGSQDAKIINIAQLLLSLDALSVRYVVRIILGTMRLGFTELTVLDALVLYLDKKDNLQLDKDSKKEVKKTLEDTYYTHPDVGLIAKTVMETGLEGISKINIEVGVPIIPQKAQRLPSFEEIIEKMGTIWAEYKFDGTRVQLHMDKNKKSEVTELEQKSLFIGADTEERMFIKTFTRNLEENSYQYPDIVEAAKKQLGADTVIVDGEAVGYDPETNEFLPFQQIMQRKRKHGVKEMAEKIPLKYFVFDILYLNGESLTNKTLLERKALLKSIVKEGDVIIIDEYPEIATVKELKNYFEIAREKGLEGLILKKPDAPYQAGARSYTWVKIKVADTQLLDDSVDCVVLGYYYGKGVRSQFGIGGFLVGVYDQEEGVYKTITKVGTGLTDSDWVLLKEKADKVAVPKQPKDVVMDKIYTPDVWTNPEIVVELGADEISISQTHSLGYALRFPRLLKFRDDKYAQDSTSPQEIKDLFNMQKRATY